MKKWYQSKTLWLNIISGGLELTQMFTDMKILPAGTLLIATNVLNMILRRFFTNTAIGSDAEGK